MYIGLVEFHMKRQDLALTLIALELQRHRVLQEKPPCPMHQCYELFQDTALRRFHYKRGVHSVSKYQMNFASRTIGESHQYLPAQIAEARQAMYLRENQSL